MPGLVHPLKVDADASLLPIMRRYMWRRPKIMLCESPPADGYNFAVGEAAHIAYLRRFRLFYHVRLKAADDRAQLQNAQSLPERVTDLGDEVRLCWEADSRVPDGIRGNMST